MASSRGSMQPMNAISALSIVPSCSETSSSNVTRKVPLAGAINCSRGISNLFKQPCTSPPLEQISYILMNLNSAPSTPLSPGRQPISLSNIYHPAPLTHTNSHCSTDWSVPLNMKSPPDIHPVVHNAKIFSFISTINRPTKSLPEARCAQLCSRSSS